MANQRFYAKDLKPILELPKDAALDARTVSHLKAVLGCMLWVAVQTGILLSARVSILHSESKEGEGNANEIISEANELIKEHQSGNFSEIVFHAFNGITDWRQIAMVTFADGSGQNRPKGASTGGLLGCAAPASILHGETTPMSPIRGSSTVCREVPTTRSFKRSLTAKTFYFGRGCCGPN